MRQSVQTLWEEGGGVGIRSESNLATDKKVESVIPILTFSISTNFFSLKQPNHRS